MTLSKQLKAGSDLGTILCRWYAQGIINRRTFVYHWENIQRIGGLYER